MATRALTAAQQKALKEHSLKWDAVHMSAMRKAMQSGKSFSEAHKIAMRGKGGPKRKKNGRK